MLKDVQTIIQEGLIVCKNILETLLQMCMLGLSPVVKDSLLMKKSRLSLFKQDIGVLEARMFTSKTLRHPCLRQGQILCLLNRDNNDLAFLNLKLTPFKCNNQLR